MQDEFTGEPTKEFVPTAFRRALLVVFAFVLFYLVSFTLDPYSLFWDEYFHRQAYQVAVEWMVTLLFCFLISESSLQINRRLNLRVPWTHNKSKRLLLEIVLNVSVVIILILMNILCFNFIYSECWEPDAVVSIDEIRGLLQWIVISLVISFMIMSFNTVSYLINNWVFALTEMAQHKVKAAELKQASVEAELTALRMQLDPHFIFNNLSVLSELILENQQLGFEYAENFAKVYRFLLVNNKRNLITLDDEVKFLQAYIFLVEHRVGTGVNFNIDIMEESKNLYIPSLTLQLLIENAIKHNATNRKKPLMIRIFNPEVGKIVVENTLSSINSKDIISTGIGLNNIINRFKLAGKRIPEVTKDEHTFRVTIELIDYDREDSDRGGRKA